MQFQIYNPLKISFAGRLLNLDQLSQIIGKSPVYSLNAFSAIRYLPNSVRSFSVPIINSLGDSNTFEIKWSLVLFLIFHSSIFIM